MSTRLKKDCKNGVWLMGLFAAWVLTTSVFAQKQQFTIAAPPRWVEPVSYDLDAKVPANEVNGGAYFILYDMQNSVRDEICYEHVVEKVLSDAGLQNRSQLSFTFDPSYQELILHTIKLQRRDRAIEQLSAAKIKILQRESDLERHIYDGRLSAVLFLEDVRVGDIIEYAYSIRGRNPIFQGKFLDAIYTQWRTPIEKLSYRLLWPQERTLHIKNHNTTLAPAITASANATEYVWQAEKIPALISDGDLPNWYNPYPWIQFSEFATWAEVGEWAQRLYSLPDTLSVELQAQIEALQKQASTPEQRAQAALRFVQDEIRYLGIEFGPHSYKPSPPSLVYARRFGDCKDKALLLSTILRRMGIEARPAFVHTAYQHTLDAWQPSPAAFDHVVVQAQIDRERWLDPTSSHQRGPLWRTYFHNYGRALVVGEGARELATVSESAVASSHTEVNESFVIADYASPVQLQVKTTYYDLMADRMRAYLAGASRSQVAKDFLNYYARRYPKVEVSQPLTIQDNEERNQITLMEAYALAEFWSASKDSMRLTASFFAQNIYDHVHKPSTSVRTMPLGRTIPTHAILKTEIILPKAWAVEPEDKTIEDQGQRFHYRCSYADKEITLYYEYKVLADMVEAAAAPEHIKNLDRIQDLLGFELYTPTEETVSAAGTMASLNWTMILLAGFFLLVAIRGAQKLYGYQRQTFAGNTVELDSGLVGLSGWLILVGIGLVGNPIQFLRGIIDLDFIFRQPSWNALTSPGTEQYHALWAPVLIYEVFCNIALLVYSILLLVLFFQKRRSFPKLMIVFIAANFVVIGIDTLLAAQIPAVQANGLNDTFKELARSIFAGLIWIPYFIVSKRAQATFVH
jgi:transglutaminase-like putative cysteine protease